MPANLLEITGLATAPAMHKAGLKARFVFCNLIFIDHQRCQVLMPHSGVLLCVWQWQVMRRVESSVLDTVGSALNGMR